MKLIVENGAVVCTAENKNRCFLSACYGLFEFENSKIKLYYSSSVYAYLMKLRQLLALARIHGVEADKSILALREKLEAEWAAIEALRREEAERREQEEKWQRLCKYGCGRCEYLAYDIDLPVCISTGETLKEKNVQGYVGGVYRLFNLQPFPTGTCPFNKNFKETEKCSEKQSEKEPV